MNPVLLQHMMQMNSISCSKLADMEMAEATSLIANYGLGDDVNDQIKDNHVEMISRSYCGKWKRLPSYLNMESVIVDDIDYLAIDEDEKRLKFLSTWKTTKGSDATYEKLISALLKIERVNDAEGVCRILQQDVTPKQKTPKPKEFSQDTGMKMLCPDTAFGQGGVILCMITFLLFHCCV